MENWGKAKAFMELLAMFEATEHIIKKLSEQTTETPKKYAIGTPGKRTATTSKKTRRRK